MPRAVCAATPLPSLKKAVWVRPPTWARDPARIAPGVRQGFDGLSVFLQGAPPLPTGGLRFSSSSVFRLLPEGLRLSPASSATTPCWAPTSSVRWGACEASLEAGQANRWRSSCLLPPAFPPAGPLAVRCHASRLNSVQVTLSVAQPASAACSSAVSAYQARPPRAEHPRCQQLPDRPPARAGACLPGGGPASEEPRRRASLSLEAASRAMPSGRLPASRLFQGFALPGWAGAEPVAEGTGSQQA